VSLVIDASVALKWVLIEDKRDQALALLTEDELIAPDLLHIECANALTMRVRRGKMKAVDAVDALQVILTTPVLIRPSSTLVAKAHALSVELTQSAYDCLYLALAIAEGATLVTDDLKFGEPLRRVPSYGSSIRLL
jgi:predicted nucleic acid-binding protein